MRLVDIDSLDAAMYHKSFEVDDGRNVWNSGLWIRYKIYEEASREEPTVDAIPLSVIRLEIKRLSKVLRVTDDRGKRNDLFVHIGALERLIYDYEKKGGRIE